MVVALPSSREVRMRSVSGLSAGRLARVRGRLVEFAGEMLSRWCVRISVVGVRCICAG